MPEITYLKSRRKEHLKTHYELRGTLERGQGGRSWWLVYDDSGHPPELIGPERNLPKASREELARLRAEPKLGQRRRARYICLIYRQIGRYPRNHPNQTNRINSNISKVS